MRGPRAKIPDEAFLTIQFRAQLEDLLFPEQIHGQRAGNNERDMGGLLAVGVFGIVLKDEGVACCVELDKLAPQGWVGQRIPVFEIVDMALGEGILVEELDDAEGLAADRQDIHCLVVVALDDFDDLRSTAHASNALGERQENTKLGLLFQAPADHFKITRLEDVQRKVSAGEKDDVQWKERNTIGPHCSSSNHTRGRGWRAKSPCSCPMQLCLVRRKPRQRIGALRDGQDSSLRSVSISERAWSSFFLEAAAIPLKRTCLASSFRDSRASN